ncbi:hypothetical protein E2C01_047131 [Portunus trituberculatus]|uniref:Uncharacterized protein n=1 Tax=Portunus trituberculatus TaxID=210409 RepID=A0A5B7G2T3_PORTR|nr:hypothetical protein [Portunus trituberculatus]
MNMETRHAIERVKRQRMRLNPFSTGTHFNLDISVRLDYFIDIKKGLQRSED